MGDEDGAVHDVVKFPGDLLEGLRPAQVLGPDAGEAGDELGQFAARVNELVEDARDLAALDADSCYFYDAAADVVEAVGLDVDENQRLLQQAGRHRGRPAGYCLGLAAGTRLAPAAPAAGNAVNRLVCSPTLSITTSIIHLTRMPEY
jgi:hypothetical protein